MRRKSPSTCCYYYYTRRNDRRISSKDLSRAYGLSVKRRRAAVSEGSRRDTYAKNRFFYRIKNNGVGTRAEYEGHYIAKVARMRIVDSDYRHCGAAIPRQSKSASCTYLPTYLTYTRRERETAARPLQKAFARFNIQRRRVHAYTNVCVLAWVGVCNTKRNSRTRVSYGRHNKTLGMPPLPLVRAFQRISTDSYVWQTCPPFRRLFFFPSTR